MKFSLFHFLGGVVFAVLLLFFLAIAVMAGSIVEALTDSHLYAMQAVYGHPLFSLLLLLLFVNILFAALRRWPFQARHLPFLMTHVGLLLLIAGVIGKNVWGMQGVLSLWEGGAADSFFLPYTMAIHVQDRAGRRESLSLSSLPARSSLFPDLLLQPVHFFSDSEMETASWIDGEWLRILGLPAIPVMHETSSFPAGVPHPDAPAWNLVAIRTEDIWGTAARLFQENLQGSIAFQGGKAEANDLSLSLDLQEKRMRVDHRGESRSLPLDRWVFESLPRPISVTCQPAVVFLQNSLQETYLFAFDPYGQLFWEKWEEPAQLYSYDYGFGGYSYPWTIPFWKNPVSPEEFLLALQEVYREKLQELSKNQELILSPPLRNLEKIGRALHLDWAALLIEFLLQKPDEGYSVAHRVVWDLLAVDAWLDEGFSEEESGSSVAMVEKYLARYGLSASLLDPALFFEEILAVIQKKRRESDPELTLETPLLRRPIPRSPRKKWEERVPSILVKLETGVKKREFASLSYDLMRRELWRPALDGQALISLRPEERPLPYRVRLREAKAIPQPGKKETWSYQAQALFTNLCTGDEQEAILSMNQVHQTPDGYRFYLSHLDRSDESGISAVRLIVNYDPFKKWLTYPGGIFLALGVFGLLFLSKKKRGAYL